MNDHLNYDKIAPQYDHRFPNNRREGTLNALRGILSQERPDYILEVGCGTCHWLKGLRAFRRGEFWGLDLSLGMLKKANISIGIYLCQASSEQMPFGNSTFQFLYCVNALHHFNGKQAFIREAYRVLQNGCKIAIIGMDPSDKRNSWYIYDYFQGTYHRDLLRFPSWAQVQSWLNEIGFQNLTFNDVEIIHDPKSGESVFSDPFLQKTGCSQLALLTEEQYQDGLRRIKQDLSSNKDNPLNFHNHIILSMMTGIKS